MSGLLKLQRPGVDFQAGIRSPKALQNNTLYSPNYNLKCTIAVAYYVLEEPNDTINAYGHLHNDIIHANGAKSEGEYDNVMR